MRKLSLLPILLILLTACNKRYSDNDLLENISKWQSDSDITFIDSILILKDEFHTIVYNPGLLNTFVNFEFTSKVLTKKGAQGAILFHTNKRYLDQGYEVRLDNSEVGDWDHLLKTGSLSSIRNVYYAMIEDGDWFDLKIRVEENHISIYINNLPVVDYIEPEMPFRLPATSKKRLNAGTFAISTLYGNTEIQLKDIRVKKLPASEKFQTEDPDFVKKITQLHSRNLPVVDYHVHEKGDLTLPLLIEKSASLGINYGVAANCGLKFPIQTNQELRAYLASIEGLPIFKAMQAEGREWVDMFDPDLVAEFDYAFTDAMTWSNRNGKRMRLWMPEETEVGDPEDFMEQLVAQIEKVVTEPISIYVNPTYLPVEIEDRYDELWTDERIDRVIAALKENNVALEINSRLMLPGKRIIEKAREAGIKFAMGTNNTNSENLGNLEWALDIVEEFNLQPTDMFLPGN